MRKIAFGIAGLLLLGQVQAEGLSPEIQYDKFLIAAQKSIEAGKFEKAADYFEKIQQLKLEPTHDFYFLSGKNALQLKNYQESVTQLESYLSKTGKEGGYYNEALVLLVEAEEGIKQSHSQVEKKEKAQVNAQQLASLLKEDFQAKDSYVTDLKKLYSVNDDAQALLIHINSFLKSEKYITYIDQNSAGIFTGQQHTVYKIKLGEPGSLVTEARVTTKKQGQADRSVINQSQQKFYGVSHQVDYTCSAKDDACFILDPANQSTWLVIKNSVKTADELTKALGYLIKVRQK